MTDDEAEAFVRNCAKGLHAVRSTHMAPASIRAITVQCVQENAVVVWIITDHLASAATSYRLMFSRLSAGVVSTDGLAIVNNGGVRDANFWDLPGNVRDLGITAGRRALGLR